jgi:GNAT superfamily N-acetyltransferase
MFLETFGHAERLVDEGQPGALLEVQIPLPMLITAGGYVEKYGPHERYNYLKVLRGAPVSTLVTFGAQEVESNMAFQGASEAVGALAAIESRIQMQTIPAADHFYTTKRPELLNVMESWLRSLIHAESIVRERDMNSPDVADLLRQAQLELLARYPDDDPHPKPLEADRFRLPDGCFLALWLGNHFVACGGIRRFDAQTAEVKRMFVEPQARRKGHGRVILRQLEAKARELGYGLIRLETGLKQPEAIALYEQAGYQRIAAFGEFKDSPLSVCFEKDLSGP